MYNSKILCSTLAAASMISVSQAALISFDGDTDSTWEIGANWSTDTEATGADQITIGSGFNVTRSSLLRLQNETTAGTLTIASGGSLTITGDLQLDQDPAAVVIDGSLIFASGGTKSNIDNGPIQGTYSLSGTMTFNDYENGIASSGVALVAPLLDFVAEGATMEALGMDVDDFSNLDGKLLSTAFFFGINGTQVNNTGTASDSTGADIVGGFYLARTDTADSVTLVLTAVPEPSSTALLGLGGLALILRRRK